MGKLTSLLFVLAAIIGCTTLSAAGNRVITWNEQVKSKILNSKMRRSLSGKYPNWKLRQQTWPLPIEISKHNCHPANRFESECFKWLTKLSNVPQLAPEFNGHVLAMKEWGLVSGGKQPRLCDVFLLRFRRGHRIVHVQESPGDVIFVVADERLARKPRTDYAQFVSEISTFLLSQPIRPDLSSPDFHMADISLDKSGSFVRGSWAIDATFVRDENGNKVATSLMKAAEIGTSSVGAETDGRFVHFRIQKAIFGPGIDYFIERFSEKQWPIGK